MNKGFVPYDESVDVLELGFDKSYHNGFYKDNNGLVIKPLYQEVFDFFRIKYNLLGCVRIAPNGNYYYDIDQIPLYDDENDLVIKPFKQIYQGVDYYDYNSAELDCLRKLIYIAKNEK